MPLLALLALGVAGVAAIAHRRRNPSAPVSHTLLLGASAGAGTYVAGRLLQGPPASPRVPATPRYPRPQRVFFSFHHRPDGEVKALLSELGEMGEFGVPIEDVSVRRRIRSRRDDRIRADLTRRVRQADALVVVVGEETATRRYIHHEVDVALDAGLPVVAVKTHRSNRAPAQLYGAGVHWAHVGNPASIRAALWSATGA